MADERDIEIERRLSKVEAGVGGALEMLKDLKKSADRHVDSAEAILASLNDFKVKVEKDVGKVDAKTIANKARIKAIMWVLGLSGTGLAGLSAFFGG